MKNVLCHCVHNWQVLANPVTYTMISNTHKSLISRVQPLSITAIIKTVAHNSSQHQCVYVSMYTHNNKLFHIFYVLQIFYMTVTSVLYVYGYIRRYTILGELAIEVIHMLIKVCCLNIALINVVSIKLQISYNFHSAHQQINLLYLILQ